MGGRRPEYHVLVDPGQLNAYGLPLTKVVDALKQHQHDHAPRA